MGYLKGKSHYGPSETNPGDEETLQKHLDEAIEQNLPQAIINHRRSLLRAAKHGYTTKRNK